MKGSKVLALLVTAAMVVGLAACGGSSGNSGSTTTLAQTETSATTVATEKPKDPVTLRVLIDDAVEFNNYPDNPVAKEIAKRTGVTLQFEVADKDRFKVILAGGDLPDIVRARNDSQQYKQLIEANNIIPLDDLLQTNGKDILTTVPDMLDFSKKYLSMGTNKTYFLTINIGPESYGIESGIGLITRWDYYKELGYPEIKNMDDYLTVLKQMQEKHPTTADGKKVYGIGLWNDWGSWCYGMITSYLTNWYGNTHLDDQTTTYPVYTMADGPLWSSVAWLHKANTMGLLDPDALIATYNDLAAKCTAGQILYAPANWPFQDFNGANNKDGKGYMALPLDWGSVWGGADWKAGWTDKGYCISKNCKTPDRAMDVLNYLWSYDGARTVFSGVEGEHWDVVNGVPTVKPEILALKTAGGDPWKALQISQNSTGLNVMVGLNNVSINPKDNAPMSLYDSEDTYAASLNPLQKDFSDHYGVKYPAAAMKQKVAEGKMLDQSKYNMYVAGAMAQAPNDIATIQTKVDQAFVKAAAKAILAKSDADYKATFDKFVEEATNLGYKQYVDWYAKAWSDAMTAVGAK